MAIVVSGTKTVSANYSPGITGAALTTIMAKAVEQLTLQDLHVLNNALSRVSGGGATHDTTVTVGSLLI